MVEAGSCLDVLVVPGDEIAHVEVSVLDARGRIIGRAPTDDDVPAVVVCGEVRTEVTLELRPRAGRGVAAVVMSAIDEPSSREAPGTGFVRLPGAAVSLDDAVRALEQQFEGASHGSAIKAVRSDGVVGRRVSFDVEVPGGCARLDLVAGAPAQGVDAWLWSSNGALAAHAVGGAHATLFGCVRGMGRLDVEATEHSGPFAFEVRGLSLPTSPFEKHPLAASRVLARYLEAHRLSDPKELGIPRSVSLSPDMLAEDAITIPAGRCLDAALGLGPGAEGAELRLVDVAGRQELARARGAFSALAGTCARPGQTPLRIKAEMTVAAGTTTALLGVHLRSETKSGDSGQERPTSGASGSAEPSGPVERASSH
jgi:hypothetical protein